MGISFDHTLAMVVAGTKTQTSRPKQPNHLYVEGGVYGQAGKAIYAPSQVVAATQGDQARGKSIVFVHQSNGSLHTMSGAQRRHFNEHGMQHLRGKDKIAFLAQHGYHPLLVKYEAVDDVDVRTYAAADALREGCVTLPEFWAIWMRMHDPFIERIHDGAALQKLQDASPRQTEHIRKLLLDRPSKLYAAWRIRFHVVNTVEVSL